MKNIGRYNQDLSVPRKKDKVIISELMEKQEKLRRCMWV